MEASEVVVDPTVEPEGTPEPDAQTEPEPTPEPTPEPAGTPGRILILTGHDISIADTAPAIAAMGTPGVVLLKRAEGGDVTVLASAIVLCE